VTGAGRGIGRATAEAFAAAGYAVVVAEVRAELGHRTERALLQSGAQALFLRTDVSDPASIEEAVRAVIDRFGRIDCLVNNAGVAPSVRADILDAGEDSFDRLIDVNLKGPYFLTQQVARWMIELRASLGAAYAPKIVTISSISAYTASVNRGDYCLSKAGLGMLTKLFAIRLAEDGIGVFEIRPGVIQTDMTSAVTGKYDKLISDGLTPIRRWGFPDDVGRAVSAVAMGSFPFSTGEVINVDGGFHLKWL